MKTALKSLNFNKTKREGLMKTKERGRRRRKEEGGGGRENQTLTSQNTVRINDFSGHCTVPPNPKDPAKWL